MATPRKDPRNPIRELEDTRSHKFRQILTREWLEPRWRREIPLCEIAQEAGCSTSTIRRYVRWFDLSPRPPQRGEKGWGAVLTAEYLEAAYVEDAMTVEAIAAEVGTSLSTVTRWLAANDIPRRGHQPGVDNLLYEELLTAEILARRLGERASLTDIAREAGCTITAVRAALRRHRLEERAATVRPPQPPCAGAEQLRSLYESGLSLEAIGVRLGVSRTKVRSDLSRFGIRPYARPGFRLTDGAWGSGAPGSGSLADKAPKPEDSPARARPPRRARTDSLREDTRPEAWRRVTLPDEAHRILLVLADHAVEDRSGRALAALQAEMGIESREVVRAAIVGLEGLGLARRDGNSARTHRLSITPEGEAWLSMAGTPTP